MEGLLLDPEHSQRLCLYLVASAPCSFYPPCASSAALPFLSLVLLEISAC